MIPKLTHDNPKILASGEGESHQLLTHTAVWKITTEDTNGRYAMFEITHILHQYLSTILNLVIRA